MVAVQNVEIEREATKTKLSIWVFYMFYEIQKKQKRRS